MQIWVWDRTYYWIINMAKTVRELVLGMICANPGIHQNEIVKAIPRDKASPNTVTKYLAGLEKDEKIRKHRRGKYAEYTPIDCMSTGDLNKTLNRTMDELEKLIRKIRKEHGLYPYVNKLRLNDRMDLFLDHLHRNIMTGIQHRFYDQTHEFRLLCEEIDKLLEDLPDGVEGKTKKKLRRVSHTVWGRMSQVAAKVNDLHEEYHEIKTANGDQAKDIDSQITKSEKIMHGGRKDLEEIIKCLTKASFGRAGVDLDKLADRMLSKHGLR